MRAKKTGTGKKTGTAAIPFGTAIAPWAYDRFVAAPMQRTLRGWAETPTSNLVPNGIGTAAQ
jgi:hypothetical protein